MNPYKAVAGQSAVLIIFLVVAFLFGREPTYWVLIVAMAAFTVVLLTLLSVYGIGRLRGHGSSRLSRWRRGGDVLAVTEALGPIAAAALCALLIGRPGQFADVFGALTISTIMTALALLFGTLTASAWWTGSISVPLVMAWFAHRRALVPTIRGGLP